MSDETRARYLASGAGDVSGESDRLDLIRDVLGDASTWTEPPPRVLEDVLAALEADAPAPSLAAAPVEERRWPILTAVIGSAVALVALVLSTLTVIDATTIETLLAMTGTDLQPGASGEAAVRPTGSGWWIRLELADLPPAPAGSYYEGWVWNDDGEGVSIGTFHMREGDGEPVILWSGVALEDYPSIWVTLEPEDEGPEASGHVVMTGRLPETSGA